MRTDTLHILSEDTDHFKKTGTHYYLVNTTSIMGYDLDNFAKSNASNTSSRAFLIGDTHSTADALVDNSLLSSCNYLNFIEFKAGDIDFQQLRRKAIESLFTYCYWKNISLNSLPVDKQFLLVYNDSDSRNFKQRARNLIQRLKGNRIVHDLYGGNLFYSSCSSFESNPTSYLK